MQELSPMRSSAKFLMLLVILSYYCQFQTKLATALAIKLRKLTFTIRINIT